MAAVAGPTLLARAARGGAGRAVRPARRARRGRRGGPADRDRAGRVCVRARARAPDHLRSAQRGAAHAAAPPARRGARGAAPTPTRTSRRSHTTSREAAADGQAAKAATYALVRRTTREPRGSPTRTPPLTTSTACRRSSWPRSPDEARRGELLLALADARWSSGEIDSAREACRLAAELADERGDPEQLARAALSFAGPAALRGGRGGDRAARRPARTSARSARATTRARSAPA